MKDSRHLTKEEILAYADDLLPHQELYKIGRHLIECADCRRQLPPPTIEQFRSAIMTEWEPYESSADVNTKVSVSSNSSPIWKLPSVWALGGAALIVLVIFTLLLLPGTKNSSADIVRSIDHETKTDLNFPAPVKAPDIDNSFSSANSNKTSLPAANTIGSRTDLNTAKSLPRKDRLQEPERKVIQNRGQISSTRGAGENCGEEKSIELEYSAEKENLVFRWKKVPKAAKYHLYISDDDEILIDEFETSGETSFVFRKSLDPLKTYKWKIIVTLENGQTIVGSSQKFSVKGFETNREKKGKKSTIEARCLADG